MIGGSPQEARSVAAVDLRCYRPADLEALAAMDALCFSSAFRFSENAMRGFAEAPNALVRLAFGRVEEGAPEMLAGFCIVHLGRQIRRGLSGYIVTLDVAPALRGRGVGYKLVRSLETLARDAGASTMWLHVSVHNDAAVRLYEKLGYRRRRLAPGFYAEGGDAHVYERHLTLSRAHAQESSSPV